MNILVIGNGFDLAHGLDTRYIDFLRVINLYRELEYVDYLTQFDELMKFVKGKKIERIFKEDLTNVITGKEQDDAIRQLKNAKNNNFWMIYLNMLLDENLKTQKGWVDFEQEIKYVVIEVNNAIDRFEKDNKNGEENFTEQIHDKYIKNALFTKKVAWTASYKEVIDVIRDDLIIMIRCLEIYMERFINRSISDNIVNVRSEDIEEYNINKVLSFNYTKTFELLYGIGKKIEYDYIHGKADISNTIETNNMVLGINEFLPEDRKNIDLKFIEFKKYYQRIYKETGCNYRRWLDEIEELNEQFDNQLIKKREHPVHNVYIYGHSLDVTDGDVLRSLILTRNVYTTIFYHNKEAMGKEIANLVRIIGQDELIKRTGGLDKTITFRKQRELRVI